jgi:hypothetical protein
VVELLVVETGRAGRETPDTVQAVRAGALFVSTLQPSEPTAPDQVRSAVASTLRRWGWRECAARTAGEFGDHPEAAVARMTWALTTVRTAYPTAAASSADVFAADARTHYRLAGAPALQPASRDDGRWR